MEFRDKLLSSEIRHVGELVNLLSYELVILQDFMQQQFGSKFKQFRERHQLLSSESEVHGASTSSSTSTSEQIRTRSVQKNASNVDTTAHQKSPIETQSDEEGSGETPNPDELADLVDPLYEASVTQSVDKSVADDDSKLDCDDPDFSNSDNENSDSDDSSSKQNALRKGKRGYGSRNRKIWSEFDCTKLPNGRKLVKCRKCHQQVSAVAKRLQKHYHRCVLGDSTYVPPVTKREVNEGEPREPRKSLAIMVWKYFSKEEMDGRIIVTCNCCKRRVSNHTTRMSRHLQNCTKSADVNIDL